ncbi:Gfo/Idh/MocA family oxidoreductase [Reichenbachiella agarivorans]|uniref:Gfo/Idh/MocA family oxidoreductase n=1 Tax=Reichenbachiella agarivorans TaxID=2979464 RepID=A0ABY6CQF5_9BACT|nr:Gfo/Idh/MocA family oxidoreductase [Reichenbachiella agarivorans]UXP32754.1 Gfo/Idh/MocA family oxidoreductase [Reichenbachiella agarivorans]
MGKGRIKLGMLGGGKGAFIGIAHRIAAYMGERYELVGGAFDSDYDKALEFASDLQLDASRVYPDTETLIKKENLLPESERIEVVSIVTPNFLHFDMAKKLLEGGFHVVCEKPMTMTSAEAEILADLVKSSGKQLCLTHTYTGYPMVRQMKTMIAAGEVGTIQRVDVQYYQGWINPLIHDEKLRKSIWRLDPKRAGISSCMGDIGVHGFNLVEYTTGIEITAVLSDLNTLYKDNTLDVDGTVLLRLAGGAKGVLRSSQIATGEENNIMIMVYGDKGALKWQQENPNELTLLKENHPLQILKPGHSYNAQFTKDSTKMPPGHPEGIFDAMGNLYRGMAKAVRGEKLENGEFPTVQDGVRGMHFIEKVVKSNKDGNVWITI